MNPTVQLLEPEILELIHAGRYSELRAALHELPPADVAELLASLGAGDAAVAFRFLSRHDAGEAFAQLDADDQEHLIHELGTQGATRVIEAMDPDDRAELLDELPAQVATRIIASLSPENRRITQTILGYPPESVGRLMTPDYVRIRPEWTVQDAMDHIRIYGRDAETVHWVYVVDERGQLIDDLHIRSLLLADPDAQVRLLMDDRFISLSVYDDQEEAVRLMGRYDRSALPVVDSEGVLLGIVTYDDVADVAEEEATEDIQLLGGLEALDKPYMQTRLGEMIRKRGSWLAILFAGQTITVLVLTAFQDRLTGTVLALFIPLVISCGGNSGSQAATLVTRALALDEVRPGDWVRVVWREILTGLSLGVLLGALGVANAAFWVSLGGVQTAHPWLLSLIVGGAVTGVVLWGTTLGSLLPILLKRAGLDPGVASTPLVATLMDASGMVIYFAVALLVLKDAAV